MSKSNFISGAALLTVTMLISKVLGFAYVIPLTKMVGTEGFILLEYAYKPYAIMISIATLGIPMAVSKFISKYNELGDYETGRRLFKSGLVLLSITGVFWACVLYFSSSLIAGWLIDENQSSGNKVEDVAFVIKTVSFALLIVPVMALIRGFFQGNQKMSPTGISQVVEQLVRVLFILLTTYLVMYHGSASIKTSIGWSTFAATIGAVASMIVLYWYWRIYKPELNQQMITKIEPINRPSLLSMYKELLYYSFPFVVVSLAIPIYQNIDLFAINPTMINQGYTQAEAEYVNSIVAIVQKIVTIPIILANAFALALVPSITKAYIGKNIESLHNQITKTFQVIFFVTLPSSVFFFVMPQETFGVLLGVSNSILGGEITKSYAFISLFFSFFIITTSIMQGINKQYLAVLSLLIGFIVKVLSTSLFISWFGGAGTSYSTMLGFGMSIFLNLWIIKNKADFSFRILLKQSSMVVLISFMTAIVMYISKGAALMWFPEFASQYLNFALVVVWTGIVSVIFYILMSSIFGITHIVFGERFKLLNRKRHQG